MGAKLKVRTPQSIEIHSVPNDLKKKRKRKKRVVIKEEQPKGDMVQLMFFDTE